MYLESDKTSAAQSIRFSKVVFLLFLLKKERKFCVSLEITKQGKESQTKHIFILIGEPTVTFLTFQTKFRHHPAPVSLSAMLCSASIIVCKTALFVG